MSDDRKQPGMGLYVGCLLALPVFYCLSIGPAVGILSRARVSPNVPDWVAEAAQVYVIPAAIVYDYSPQPLQKVVEVYVDFFD